VYNGWWEGAISITQKSITNAPGGPTVLWGAEVAKPGKNAIFWLFAACLCVNDGQSGNWDTFWN
jgi:hypothetical protein